MYGFQHFGNVNTGLVGSHNRDFGVRLGIVYSASGCGDFETCSGDFVASLGEEDRLSTLFAGDGLHGLSGDLEGGVFGGLPEGFSGLTFCGLA